MGAGGSWHDTTAATNSEDLLYAIQKGDLYSVIPDGSDAGTYSKLSEGWGEMRCMAYHGDKLYIIWKYNGKLYLYEVDPQNYPNGRNKQELPGSDALCMVSRRGRLYYIADKTLYIVDPVHGGRQTTLTSLWSGATCMTSLGDFLYIVANSDLYRVDPENGQPKTSFGGYSDTPCMTSYNGYLYLVQNKNLWRVNGMSGKYWNLSTSPNTWHDSTVMTTIPNYLYIVQNGRLYRVNPDNGEYTSLG